MKLLMKDNILKIKFNYFVKKLSIMVIFFSKTYTKNKAIVFSLQSKMD